MKEKMLQDNAADTRNLDRIQNTWEMKVENHWKMRLYKMKCILKAKQFAVEREAILRQKTLANSLSDEYSEYTSNPK